MKVIVVAFFAVCAVGSSLALDCSAKFTEFHKCLGDARKAGAESGKAKFDSLKSELDACYTKNGCTPPVRPQKGASSGGASSGASGERHGNGNNTAGRECHKALREASKQKFQECIKIAVPDVTFPHHDENHDDKPHFGGHKGFNHKDENKHLDGCEKKQAVRDCKRALFNSSRPSEDEKRAQFKAHCDAKDKCLVALGADCQAQMEKFKKAACQCHQQQFAQIAQIRASVSACKGLPDNKGKGKHQGGGKDEKKQKSCDETSKNYCKLGYDAFVQDHHHDGKKGQ